MKLYKTTSRSLYSRYLTVASQVEYYYKAYNNPNIGSGYNNYIFDTPYLTMIELEKVRIAFTYYLIYGSKFNGN